MANRLHKDCPFSREEIDAIKAELYYMNSTNQCTNPPHPSWYTGLNDWQCSQQSLKNDAYREWLEKELQNITRPSGGTCKT